MARFIGGEIQDCRTGRPLGRGLVWAWRGKVYLIGVDAPLIPEPVAQSRITYWRQSIGFTCHPEPDFPRQEPAISILRAAGKREPHVLLVLLDHRSAGEIPGTLQNWVKHGFQERDILLAYGGEAGEFARLDVANKIFVANPRLNTKDHQRESQSYRAVFSGVAEWLQGRAYTHIFFVEYDEVPVVDHIAEKFLAKMTSEDADVLCHKLMRVDSTIYPHWLGCPQVPLRRREVLSMLGTGHFWKREAWEAVAADNSLSAWYLELDLPTTAHTLGFRVRGLPEQSGFVTHIPEDLRYSPEEGRKAGAWTLHPVK